MDPRYYSSPKFTRREALRVLGLAGTAALLPSGLAGAAETVSGQAAVTPAPSLAGRQAGYYRFRIGEFEALALNDGEMASPVSEAPFGVGEPREKLSEELQRAVLPTDKIRIPFNVLLVRMGSELVLVDAGCGTVFGPVGGRLAENLRNAGVRPEQVTAVILTHAHGDHFGGLLDAETQAPVFKNAQHFINHAEYDFWTASSPDLSGVSMPEEVKQTFIKSAQSCLGALRSKWEMISPGDRVLEGLEVVPAPGHTPGHIALLFSSGNEQLLHLVDAVHHHVLSFAHPEWAVAFDAQPKLAIDTRKRLLDRAAADRLRVFGGHLPFPSLGRVRGTGRFEYLIEPWTV